MTSLSEELILKIRLNSYLRCPCEKHTYRNFECRWIKFEFWKETHYFNEKLFWKSLKIRDFDTLAMLTKSELLFCKSYWKVLPGYLLEDVSDPGVSLKYDDIWGNYNYDYKKLYDWYYKMSIDFVFIDVNTDFEKMDPRMKYFLKQNDFPFNF